MPDKPVEAKQARVQVAVTRDVCPFCGHEELSYLKGYPLNLQCKKCKKRFMSSTAAARYRTEEEERNARAKRRTWNEKNQLKTKNPQMEDNCSNCKHSEVGFRIGEVFFCNKMRSDGISRENALVEMSAICIMKCKLFKRKY